MVAIVISNQGEFEVVQRPGDDADVHLTEGQSQK